MGGSDIVAPRGIRNNNPGNLEANGVPWDGVNGDDGRFYTFESSFYGLRAMAKLLSNYGRLYGVNTVRGIVSRYAPTHENNSVAYMQHVAKVLQVELDQPIKLDDANRLAALVKVMIRHENGQQPYSENEISKAVKAALV